jgi:hypothetical protein
MLSEFEMKIKWRVKTCMWILLWEQGIHYLSSERNFQRFGNISLNLRMKTLQGIFIPWEMSHFLKHTSVFILLEPEKWGCGEM